MDDTLKQLTAHRRALHRIPEIRFDLPRTREYILNELSALPRARVKQTDHGAILCYFDAGKPDSFAFRCDMDALNIAERTGVEFASQNPGKMHACGHDGHMAIMLCFARYLDGAIERMPRNALVIFQPAEENGGGGEFVAKSGALERHGVRAIFALHGEPGLEIGQMGSRSGAFMARTCEVWAGFTGRAAHVGRASEGIDALYAAAQFVLRAYAMESAMPGEEKRLLKFGVLNAGTAQNIISGHARLGGALRTYSQRDHEYLSGALRGIARDLEKETGVKIDLSLNGGYPPVINDAALYARARNALGDIPFVEYGEPLLLGEDFSYYQQVVPGVMLYYGLGNGIPLHSDNFNFDERALLTGLEAFKRLLQMEEA